MCVMTVFVFIEKPISKFEKEEPLSAGIITYVIYTQKI